MDSKSTLLSLLWTWKAVSYLLQKIAVNLRKNINHKIKWNKITLTQNKKNIRQDYCSKTIGSKKENFESLTVFTSSCGIRSWQKHIYSPLRSLKRELLELLYSMQSADRAAVLDVSWLPETWRGSFTALKWVSCSVIPPHHTHRCWWNEACWWLFLQPSVSVWFLFELLVLKWLSLKLSVQTWCCSFLAQIGRFTRQSHTV